MGIRTYRYKIWIRQAEFDLQAAKVSFGNNFFEWACFESEQSAEKALKGLMMYCGEMPPKLHKLSILLRMTRKVRPDIGDQLIIESLQAYTFVSRYPFILPGDNLTPHDFMTTKNATECIKEAEGVLLLVNTIINPEHGEIRN